MPVFGRTAAASPQFHNVLSKDAVAVLKSGGVISKLNKQGDLKVEHKFIGRFVRLRSRISALFSRANKSRVSTQDKVAGSLFDRYCAHVDARGGDQKLNHYRVACAMTGAGIASMRMASDGEVTVIGSGHAVNSERLEKLDMALRATPAQQAYQFFEKGQPVPKGFLDNVLVPHYVEQLSSGEAVSPEVASTMASARVDAMKKNHIANVILPRLVRALSEGGKLPPDEAAQAADKLVAELGLKDEQRQLTNTIKLQLEQGHLTPADLESKLASHLTTIPLPVFDKLRPSITEELTKNPLSSEEALQVVQGLMSRAGIKGDRDVTFERLLVFKQNYRNQYPRHAASLSGLSHPAALTRPNPQSPQLDGPAPGQYLLDEEDVDHIMRSVAEGNSLYIPRHDLRNRLKRLVLRNKRKVALFTTEAITFTVIAGLSTGGIGAAAALGGQVGGLVAVSGGIAAFRRIKTAQQHDAMQKNADYELNEDQYLDELADNPVDEALKQEADSLRKRFLAAGVDGKKLAAFLKNAQYFCSHKAMTDIFNAYSELEKDYETAQKLHRFTKGNDTSDSAALPEGRDRVDIRRPEDAIKARESQERVAYRIARLRQLFNPYEQLIVGTVRDITRMDAELDVKLDQLWKERFENNEKYQTDGQFDKDKVAALFSHAANDFRVKHKKWYQVGGDQREWVGSVLPRLKTEAIEAEPEEGEAGYKRIQAKKLYNRTAEKGERGGKYVFGMAKMYSKEMAKLGAVNFAKLMGKAIKSGSVDTVVQGAQGIKPTPTPAFLAALAVFYIAENVTEKINTKVNKWKLRKEKTGVGFLQSEQTGREKVGTARVVGKGNMEKFMSNLQKMHKKHEKLKQVVDNGGHHVHLKKQMSDYEIAVLLLRRQRYEEDAQKLMAEGIADFHERVVGQGNAIETKLSDLITT